MERTNFSATEKGSSRFQKLPSFSRSATTLAHFCLSYTRVVAYKSVYTRQDSGTDGSTLRSWSETFHCSLPSGSLDSLQEKISLLLRSLESSTFAAPPHLTSFSRTSPKEFLPSPSSKLTDIVLSPIIHLYHLTNRSKCSW